MLELMRRNYARLFKEARKAAIIKPTLFSSPVALDNCHDIESPSGYSPLFSKIRNDPSNLRKNDIDEITQRVKLIERIGISIVQLRSYCAEEDLDSYIYEYVRFIKKYTKIKIYGAFEVLNKISLQGLVDAGMDGYWCPIEVPSEKLYRRIRPGDCSLNERLNTLETAKRLGLNTWSGFWFGIGETLEDVAGGVEMLREVNVNAVSILPFKPHPYTEMQWRNPVNPLKWAKTVAAIRLYMPAWDLFADVSLAAWGARAGANGFSPILISNTFSNLENIKELRKLTGRIRS